MALANVTGLECTICGKNYSPDELSYVCPDHDQYHGILDVQYDYDTILNEFQHNLDGNIPNMWKYRPFLPVDKDADLVTLGEGGTDFYDAPRLSDRIGVTLFVKDDSRNPTAALKDRASSVSVTKARSEGIDVVTCASTGNAAASLAGYAARAGLDCKLFVPGDTSKGKLAQHLIYGATVLAVNGTYDEAFDLSLEITEAYGWYNRNAAINPFQVEGKRTVGHEIAEQAQSRGVEPDWLAISMGDGCSIAGAWKGVSEFHDLDFVESVPKMLGVQAEGAPKIHDSFHGKTSRENAGTLADGIAVGVPRNKVKALRSLEASGGTTVLVTDEEILEAERLLAKEEGIFAEPAGAAPVAGVRTAVDQGIITRDETVVVIVTGYGLKDIESARKATGSVQSIDPTLDAFATYQREFESSG